MIDITQDQGSGSCYLTKLSVRRDGTSGNNLIFDVDLCYLVADQDAAAVVDRVIPGAFEMHERATSGEEGKTSVKVSPSNDPLICNICYNDTGAMVFDGESCVQTITYAVSAKSISATFKVRLLAVEECDAGSICGALGSSVMFSFIKSQQGFDFAKKPEKGSEKEKNTVKENPLVLETKEDTRTVFSAITPSGDYAFGSFSDKSGEFYCLDDFGVSKKVDDQGIISKIVIKGVDGHLSGMLESYENKVKTFGKSPTWEYIIMAIGDEFASSLSNGSGSSLGDEGSVVGLSWKTLTEAIKYSKTA